MSGRANKPVRIDAFYAALRASSGHTIIGVILSGARALFARAQSKDPYSRGICCLALCRHRALIYVLAPAQQPTPWNKVQAPPLPAFTPAEPTRIQLKNGMVIFLQPDHELPLISAIARIRGGSVSEPADKTGLTDLYGDVWRTGGTKTKTGDQMDDFLEARAAKIETDNQSDSTTISLNCLKGDFDAVFDYVPRPAAQPRVPRRQARALQAPDLHRHFPSQR